MTKTVHLDCGEGRVRCNRQGMQSHTRPTVGVLRATDDLDAVTCHDCKRLATLDGRKGRAA